MTSPTSVLSVSQEPKEQNIMLRAGSMTFGEQRLRSKTFSPSRTFCRSAFLTCSGSPPSR